MANKRWSQGLNPDGSDSKAYLFRYTISLTGMKSYHGSLLWNSRLGTVVEGLSYQTAWRRHLEGKVEMLKDTGM